MSESDYSAYKAYPALHAAEPAATRPAESVARAEGGASASPLRSQESFDAYCRQVQTRLAEHAAQRATFLRAAYERLTRLLHTARAVEDTALYNELWQHRIAVRELLESLTQASTSPGAWPSVPPPSKPVPLQAANGHFTREVTPTEGTMRSISSPPPIAAVRTTSAPEPPQPDPEPLPRLPRHPVRPLIDIEADAVRLRGELHDWNNSYPLRRPSGEINIPNALKLRAMACRQRRLEEEAGDTEVAEVT